MSIEILNGNELIIQGGLEAGFSLYTGYPGSPLADYFNILFKRKQELKERGIKVVIANSEANAAAMASGAKQAGRDCLVAMKSMGLHVASDALSVGNFANPGEKFLDPETGEMVKPGTVVVVGDDPWSMSTSTAADSRYLYKHLHIPFLEPSTPQELKDWIKHALYLSRRTSIYQGVLLTTFMAEGGGRVEIAAPAAVNREAISLDTSKFDLSKNVMVPPNSLNADRVMIKERFPKVKGLLDELGLDQQYGKGDSRIGFISSGVIFETVKQVLEEGGYLDHFSLYKVACSYPLAEGKLIPWLQGLDHLIVIEEKRGFLESELEHLCGHRGISLKIHGKNFGDAEGFPAYGGLNYEIVNQKLLEVFSFLKIDPCRDLTHVVNSWDTPLPKRLPTFCPGCPHRETLSLLVDLRKNLKEKGMDLVSHGDVGCYSLSFLPPFGEMHNLSAMGQGGALAAGVDMFTTNPSVVLMGDSTFYHSGITDISNSVQLGHNITYILLDNDNTAMTGHQVSPSTGINVAGDPRPHQDMLGAVKALGVQHAVEVNPSDRYFYKNLLEGYIQRSGVKVIVSNKECGLTFHGRRKAAERKIFAAAEVLPSQKFYQINTAVCEDCRACVELTGCPGLSQTFDAYGSKISIDPQVCVSDSYCTKIKACPSFELVEVVDYHPTKYQDLSASFEKEDVPFPKPVKSFESIAGGEDLRVVVTGVGGSGVTTISRVLAEAAKEMDGRDDLDFKFVDQKGLAQRNGNVTAHLAIYKKGKSYGAVTPQGSADLLLSPDLLDGSRHIGFLGEKGLCLLDRKFQVPLSILLDKGETSPPMDHESLQKQLGHKLGDQVAFFALKDLSQLILGKSVYASAMLLGVAYQSGRLPFGLKNMEDAFERTMNRQELSNNLQAFHIGRKIYLEGDEELLKSVRPGRKDSRVQQIRMSLEESFLAWESGSGCLRKFDKYLDRLSGEFPEIKKYYLARYLHDILVYDRGEHLSDFIDDCSKIKALYGNDTVNLKMALRTLAKTYWIKDEVFVAHLMVSSLQKRIDRARYSKLGTNYKVTHINRPGFDVFGKKIEFDINPKDWMLKLMRHLRFLRKLMPAWHHKERQIASAIRNELISGLEGQNCYKRLKELENIKGYREVRHKKAKQVLGI